jgi:hypothetical protein
VAGVERWLAAADLRNRKLDLCTARLQQRRRIGDHLWEDEIAKTRGEELYTLNLTRPGMHGSNLYQSLIRGTTETCALDDACLARRLVRGPDVAGWG